jgi:hypothetical protein
MTSINTGRHYIIKSFQLPFKDRLKILFTGCSIDIKVGMDGSVYPELNTTKRGRWYRRWSLPIRRRIRGLWLDIVT